MNNIEEKYKLNLLDSNIIKAFAVVFLLMHHLFYTAETYTKYNISDVYISNEMLLELGVFSKVCLALFVFISGYGLNLSYKKTKDIRKKVADKILDLFIKFWFVFIIVAIISLVLPKEISGEHNVLTVYFNYGVFPGLYYVALDMLCLSTLFGTPSLNLTWWWMPTAFSIFVVVAIFREKVKTFGFSFYIFSVFALMISGLSNMSSMYLLPTLILGMLFSEFNYFDRLAQILRNNNILIVFVSCIFVCCIYTGRRIIPGIVLYDSLFPIPICFIVKCVFEKIPYIKNFLNSVGRLSMYIFLTHTFIKSYWFPKFIYSWKDPIIIFVVLFILTYIVSFLIDFLYGTINRKYNIKKCISKLI